MKKYFGLIFLGVILFCLAALIAPRHKPVRTHQISKQWDGNPNHPDCSPGGHPDPKNPGVRISDQYTAACEGK